VRAQLFIHIDAGDTPVILAEVAEIASRRFSLLEFRDCLLQIRDGLGDAFETRRVDIDDGPAAAGDLVLRAQFCQSFLDRVAALRALDRDFDALGRAHGASV